MVQTLFCANLKLPKGGYISGSVSTADNKKYIFANTSPDSDLFFSVKKDELLKWHIINTSGFEIPQTMVNQLGNLVDYHKTDPNIIELLAEFLLPQHLPKDASVNDVSFEFSLAPDLNLKAYFKKIAVKKGKATWKFQCSKVIY